MLIFFTSIIIAFAVFFISKRNGMKDKIFGILALYIYLNLLMCLFWKEIHMPGVLYFASAIDAVFLVFIIFILKYVAEGENN